MKGEYNDKPENDPVIHQTETGENIGDILKKARKAKKLTLEEVSRQTRIPIRHLESLEANSTKGLPATTYSAGFVKTYAQLLDLDGADMAARFRQTMGEATRQQPIIEPYAPADPTRVPPLRLIIPCLVAAAIIIMGGIIWNRHHVDASLYTQNQTSSLGNIDGENNTSAENGTDTKQSQAIAGSEDGKGKVVLSATKSVWLRLYDGKSGPVLVEKTLNAGEHIAVPDTAKNPMLQTNHPESLTIALDNKILPASILPTKRVKDFSLLENNLVKVTTVPSSSSAMYNYGG
ncbi:MAG: helix-turn-helix transcriptional regulator [Zymomonas mobilis]|uniref:Cytoskeletal protein RodZ n=1 Tax=Zymomonas mobilis TaxID=542 RepID=A0A542W378_ZYMMB|nr:helix-turn-helix transcriptional regulator [Zymomonas mobilis]TQL17959.1 cytoskeletal protein RodZ [Zymomonas mobilis]